MSFGINGPSGVNLSAVQQTHKSNDGGAGNFGYFQQGKKKKDEEEQETDMFESSSKEDDKEDLLMKELDSIGTRIKNFWKSINENRRI